MNRTLDDHCARCPRDRRMRALDRQGRPRVRLLAGRHVRYQSAAFLSGGHRVDHHVRQPGRPPPHLPAWTSDLAGACRPLCPRRGAALSRLEGLPGKVTSTAFKLLTARRRRAAHRLLRPPRSRALVKREAKQLSSAAGLRRVARPGISRVRRGLHRPQPHAVGRLRHRRTHRVARRPPLPDPVFVGVATRWAARAVAAPAPRRARRDVEVRQGGPLRARRWLDRATGTWPSVVDVDAARAAHRRTFDVRRRRPEPDRRVADTTTTTTTTRARRGSRATLPTSWREDRAARPSSASRGWASLGAYLDNARWQLPRLRGCEPPGRLAVSLGRALAEQAARSASARSSSGAAARSPTPRRTGASTPSCAA